MTQADVAAPPPAAASQGGAGRPVLGRIVDGTEHFFDLYAWDEFWS